MKDILKARRKLCFSLAESVAPEVGEQFDIDEAAKIIDMRLPMTYAEADAALAEMLRPTEGDYQQPRKPSFFNQLRDAVHATDGMSIKCVVEAAVEAIHERDRLNEAKKETSK